MYFNFIDVMNRKCAKVQVDSAMEERWKKICLDVVDEVMHVLLNYNSKIQFPTWVLQRILLFTQVDLLEFKNFGVK